MIENSYKLSIPAPEFLPEAMNVAPEAKQWLGIYYTSTNPTWSDGGWSKTFSYCDVYYPLLNNDGISIELVKAHQKLKPEYNIDFGSDDSEATHILLLNQHSRDLYIAEFKVGIKFLREQYPKPDKDKQTVITKEEWEQIVLEHKKYIQECMQNPSKFGMFESLFNISLYRSRIINWFNNYCMN